MKKILSLGLCLVMLYGVNAQVQNPVQWNFRAVKLNATTYKVILAAEMEQGWHVYSQSTPGGGPVPTKITFAKNPLLLVVGKATEDGKLEQRHEPLFGVDVKQFSNEVSFIQMIKVKGVAKTSLTGSVEFMTCDDTQCLPPKTQKFTIALK